jgi:hypothetical protein
MVEQILPNNNESATKFFSKFFCNLNTHYIFCSHVKDDDGCRKQIPDTWVHLDQCNDWDRSRDAQAQAQATGDARTGTATKPCSRLSLARPLGQPERAGRQVPWTFAVASISRIAFIRHPTGLSPFPDLRLLVRSMLCVFPGMLLLVVGDGGLVQGNFWLDLIGPLGRLRCC